MTALRPGQSVRLTEDGRRVTIWSAAPGPGCYWAHVEDQPRVALIRVTNKATAPQPVVVIVEES